MRVRLARFCEMIENFFRRKNNSKTDTAKKPTKVIESPPINFENEDDNKSNENESNVLESDTKTSDIDFDSIIPEKQEEVCNIQEIQQEDYCKEKLPKKDKPTKRIESSERYAELKKLYENLMVLANIKNNEKLWLENDTLSIDTTWVPIFSRWRFGQSREIIIPFVAKVVTNGSMEENIQFQEIYETFIGLINGITLIKKMYPEKEMEINSLVKLIDDVINMY